MERTLTSLLVTLALLTGCQGSPAPKSAPQALEGSSWRLVQLTFSDGTTRAAIDRSRYTLGFGAGDVLNVRFDCNRGRGSWKSAGPGQLQFGELALTRALCPTGSLYDDLVRQWPYVRSYLFKDGRLFLTLMADGGSIEFEPAP
jgi:para-nitrobenzyl esterase